MAQFLQAVVLLGAGVFLIWLITLATRDDDALLPAHRLIDRVASRLGGSSPFGAQAPKNGPLTLSQYGRALYRSVVDDNRQLFWTRSTVISGVQWVVVCGPSDYHAICADISALVDDLRTCFTDQAAAKKLVFDGSLDIVQVICRHQQPDGKPALMTYARARSLELLADAQTGQMAPGGIVPENELLSADELNTARQQVAGSGLPVMTGPRAARGAGAQATPSSLPPVIDVFAGVAGVSPAPGSPAADRAPGPAQGGPTPTDDTMPFDLMQPWMELIAAPEDTREVPAFTVAAGDEIGRDVSHGVRHIPCAKVSSTHVRFAAPGGKLTVIDCDSRNGLWIEGLRVASHTLRDGDVIGLGRHVSLRYHAPLDAGGAERTDGDDE